MGASCPSNFLHWKVSVSINCTVMSADPAKTFFPSFETFTHVASAVNFATVPIIKKGKNVIHDVGVYKKLFSKYLVDILKN